MCCLGVQFFIEGNLRAGNARKFEQKNETKEDK